MTQGSGCSVAHWYFKHTFMPEDVSKEPFDSAYRIVCVCLHCEKDQKLPRYYIRVISKI